MQCDAQLRCGGIASVASIQFWERYQMTIPLGLSSAMYTRRLAF